MHRSSDSIFVITGLGACTLVGILPAIEIWLGGPSMISHSRQILAVFARFIASIIAGDAADRAQTAFHTYLSLYLLSMAAFAAAFWLRIRPSPSRPAVLDTALLAAQVAIGVTAAPDLLFIVAAELAFVLPQRPALAWLGAQMAALIGTKLSALLGKSTPLLCNLSGVTPPPLETFQALGLGWDIAWQTFAFCVGYVASMEQRSRRRLAQAHAEQAATHQLLAETIRASERLRIARDLHDAIGHHLTALNLHLDLALRQEGGHAAEPVRVSRELAQRLLQEARAAVSAERDVRPINLRQALQTMCAGMPSPRIDFSCDDGLDIGDPAVAHAIFRSIQEALSNAVRHSGASAISIALCRQEDGVALAVNDNGKGVSRTDAGNGSGLRGIQERVAELGGKMETGNRQDGGFGIRIWLPQTGGAT